MNAVALHKAENDCFARPRLPLDDNIETFGRALGDDREYLTMATPRDR
ncbi:MAG: hypothetical protein OER95_09230 [Acidimicrobiia bacterium]|nr:hypothetical protein [Acidimicrobiia bacterium]